MYLIRGLEPNKQIMAAHSFGIELSPQWPTMVALSKLTQQMIDTKIETCGRHWLDSCGYDAMFDPDSCGFDVDDFIEGRTKPLGPNARPLFEHNQIRVMWGEWGPEHISVPGNACGLDIERRAFGAFIENAAMLCPHNIDCWSQKQLLLMVFCSIAEDVVLFSRKV